MRITFRGESEKALIQLSEYLKMSPTEVLTSYLFMMKDRNKHTAHIEEVINELHKPHKRFIPQNSTHRRS